MDEFNKELELAIEQVNNIKRDMIQSGNEISKIVFNIREELEERNACKMFAERTGMSKASISKMVYSERERDLLGIKDIISYNLIYRLKDIMCSYVADMLNDGMSEQEIRKTLTTETETDTETDTETETDIETETETETETSTDETIEKEQATDIKGQILDILSSYDIEKDDLKAIKSLLKSLR